MSLTFRQLQTECRFSIKRKCDMIRTQLKISCRSTGLSNYLIHSIVKASYRHDSFPPISGNPPMVTFVKTIFFSFIINLNKLCKVRYILDVILGIRICQISLFCIIYLWLFQFFGLCGSMHRMQIQRNLFCLGNIPFAS